MEKIYKLLQNFGPIKNREPFMFHELSLYIKEIQSATSAAIRNILLNPYYEFGYKNISRGVYVPAEMNTKLDAVKSFVHGEIYSTGHALRESLGLTTQNFSKKSYIVFGEVSPNINKFTNEFLQNITLYVFPNNIFQNKVMELVKIKAYLGDAVPGMQAKQAEEILWWYMKKYKNIYKEMDDKGKIFTHLLIFDETKYLDLNFPKVFDADIIASLAKVIYCE